MIGLLIVDDEEGVRRSLKKVLEKEGYTIFLADNGEKALAVMREHAENIEIVISDFRMPGMDGLETLVAIKAINPEITRIILTGYATIGSAIEAVNAGLDGFIVKPFENQELGMKVREYNVRKRLKEFVSEKVLTEMVKNGKGITPRNQKVSIVFIDIRGFSRLSERLSPQEVSHLLSKNYFSPLDNIIHEYNGTLDKHIGDGIMGIFGAPISYGDDAVRAVLSAVRMREEMMAINESISLKENSLTVGIGVCTGEAMVGIFGSNRKKEYTGYGFTVNLAARLERLARANQILICPRTFQEVQGIVEAVKMEPVGIRGIERQVDVYSVVREKNEPLSR